MATRLYLPTAGTPGQSPAIDVAWERSIAAFARFPMSTAKANSVLTTYSALFGATSTSQTCWHQWVSDTLDVDQTITGTMSMVIGKCAETTLSGDAHLAFSLRVIKPDGTVRGTLLLYHATSTEFALIASAATRIHSARALTSVAALAGDRIVCEIGIHGVTPANETMQLRFGDPSATADFALTAALTTDLDPWLELSQNITFGAPPSNPSISSASMADADRDWNVPFQDIAVTFSEAVDITPTPNVGDTVAGLTVNVNGGADAALTYRSGNGTASWKVRRAELIQQNDTVVMDYSQAAGAILAVDDNAELEATVDKAVTNNQLTKRVRAVLLDKNSAVLNTVTVKYAIQEYDSGAPVNANWMARTDKGTAATTATGQLDVQYTGATAVGGTVYLTVIQPDTTPTEAMVWSQAVD